MKLLNSCTWEIKEFISNDVPPYAIFSHTWTNGEEVSHRNWKDVCSREIQSRTKG